MLITTNTAHERHIAEILYRTLPEQAMGPTVKVTIEKPNHLLDKQPYRIGVVVQYLTLAEQLRQTEQRFTMSAKSRFGCVDATEDLIRSDAWQALIALLHLISDPVRRHLNELLQSSRTSPTQRPMLRVHQGTYAISSGNSQWRPLDIERWS